MNPLAMINLATNVVGSLVQHAERPGEGASKKRFVSKLAKAAIMAAVQMSGCAPLLQPHQEGALDDYINAAIEEHIAHLNETGVFKKGEKDNVVQLPTK